MFKTEKALQDSIWNDENIDKFLWSHFLRLGHSELNRPFKSDFWHSSLTKSEVIGDRFPIQAFLSVWAELFWKSRNTCSHYLPQKFVLVSHFSWSASVSINTEVAESKTGLMVGLPHTGHKMEWYEYFWHEGFAVYIVTILCAILCTFTFRCYCIFEFSQKWKSLLPHA